ncbi:gamma-glutamyltransferase [Saccharomonospora sp. NPDC046836]|uniref:gamma-glutamyltransferase n=1 Tax=Saccharomonospora sp. NPDC046836 TaxID=3156921 RepID=UPI0033D95D71
MTARTPRALASVLTATACATALIAPAAHAGPRQPAKSPEAVGYFGAVSSVDVDATQAGIDVLRRGGNAVDAAVATAAALGVTDPFSAGIGGGGFLVYYDARSGRVQTLDGRETAPASAHETMFVEDGAPIPFGEAVTSGLGVGVPGSPALWQDAISRWGNKDLAAVLKPAERIARDGFTVDAAFNRQVTSNAERFAAFPATRELYLPGGEPPAVGSRLTNPDLAGTYRLVAKKGVDAFYEGAIASDIADTVQHPPVDPASGRNVRPGGMTTADIAAYETVERAPTHTEYRGLDVYGMPAPSSGGITVAETLNILENYDLGSMSTADHLHHFLEATRLSFADRNRWIGDPAFVDVPSEQLLSQEFADSRACLLNPAQALTSPVPAGNPHDPEPCTAEALPAPTPVQGENTTHVTTADRWGNMVAYTLTIEQEGGSGMVVPGRGFLLNNELTDFSFTPVTPGVPDPNLPAPGKRPRSSMSPTIILKDGVPLLAVGSPGGASIITTVSQVLLGRLDRGLSLVDAIAAPRASQRNSNAAQVEQEFLDQPETAQLREYGQGFAAQATEIGAVTGIERLRDGRWLAAAEPVRRGGGSAQVVLPWEWPHRK